MTVDIATLAIRIDSTQAQVATQAMDRMRDSGSRAEQQAASLDAVTRKLSQALQLLGVGAGVGAIIRMADEYTKFNAQIKLASQSQREYAEAVDDVRRIANAAQQDLAATGTLYARISNGTRELGVQQKQVAAITETANLALKVSGATAAESASAQLQLSQAFASGALRGEEFNAVNEAAPRLMKALADGLGVPIGALRNMASEGQITSKIMADVLPGALAQLRDEAKQVQTIGGAFTTLKNNVMGFIGAQTQASGIVAILTGAIGLLADNLNLLAGVMGTVASVAVVNWLTAWTVKTYERITAAYAQVAAENAARAATIAAAEADLAHAGAAGALAAATQAAILIAREEAVARLTQAHSNIAAANAAIAAATAAGAQSFALRTLTLATAELAAAETARAAMVAELALLGQQQARVAAQVTAATAAQTAAQAALTTASAAGAASIGLAGRAMGLLGGPVGAVVTVLGLAATAWSWYSSRSAEANAKTADDTKQSTAEVIAQMTKQIEVMERRNKLALSGAPSTGKQNPLDDKLADILAQIDQVGKADGDYAKLSLDARTDILKVLGGQYAEVTALIERFNKASADGAGNTAAAKALVEIRERLSGVSGQYQKDLKTYQTALDEGVIGMAEYKAGVTALAQETWKGSDAGKSATAATQKSAEAYKTLISSVRESIATNKLELELGANATESQKASIKLTQELASGKLKLGAAHLATVRAALAEQAATEQLLKVQQSEKSTLDWIIASTQARLAARDSLAAEYQLYGQSADARELAMIAIKAEADLEAELTARRDAGKIVTDETIAQMRREKDMRVGVTESVLAQKKALGYAQQLTDENKRYAAESIFDERERAAAILRRDAEVWQKRIELAGEGTEAQKILQEQYVIWYADQVNKPMIDQWRESVKKYDDIFRTGFADMLNNGKSGWASFTKSLTTTFKTSVADQIYKMFAQPFVMKLVASLIGVTGSAAAGAAQSVGGSMFGSAAGALTLGGSTIAAIGSSVATGVSAGLAGTGIAEAAAAYSAAGMTGVSAGLTAGSAIGSAMAAIPVYGWAALAAVAVASYLDNSGTYHTGGAASASAAGVSTIRAESLNFEATQVSTQGQEFVNGLASGIVSILDGTASAFGKTAGYTAATAFADDTSKDGAWGGLVISKLGAKVLDWQDTKTGSWAPKTFSDGDAGKAEYLAALSTSVRTALDDIGLPSWAGSMLDALGAAPTIEKLTATVNAIVATQSALATLGDRLVGFAGMSDAAASALMAASGGIDKLTANASTYYDRFYNDGEKAAAVTKSLSASLAAVGLALPKTDADFRALVETQMGMGEASAKAVSVLLANAGAFADLTASSAQATAATKAQSDATAALTEHADLQRQVDELTMSSAQLLGKERAALLDDESRALFDQVQALKSAKAATEAYNTSVADARSALSSAYSREAGELQGLVSKYKDAAKAARAYGQSLIAGQLSPLSDDVRLSVLKKQFEQAKPENLQGAASAYLELLKTQAGSDLEYMRGFTAVQAAIDKSAKTYDNQAAFARDQLSALDASVAGIVDVADKQQTTNELLERYLSIVSGGVKAAGSTSSVATAWNGSGIDVGGGTVWDSSTGFHPAGTQSATTYVSPIATSASGAPTTVTMDTTELRKEIETLGEKLKIVLEKIEESTSRTSETLRSGVVEVSMT